MNGIICLKKHTKHATINCHQQEEEREGPKLLLSEKTFEFTEFEIQDMLR